VSCGFQGRGFQIGFFWLPHFFIEETVSFLLTAEALSGRLYGFVVLGVVLTVLPWSLPGLSGQSRDLTLRGSVVDTLSGDPVPGVLLRLDTGQEVKTGLDGSFLLTGLETGTRSVAIVTAGCRITFASFDATEASQAPLVFQVGVGAVNESVVPPDPLPGSRIVSGSEIEEMHVGTMVELLRRVAPELIQSVSGQPGSQPRITSRGVASAQGPVSPILVLDGVNMGSLESPDVLDTIQPIDIAYLELFRGAMGGWSYGTGGSGGVIRVTTKRGGPLSPPNSDLKKCAIPDWRWPPSAKVNPREYR
jgi:hypothetical protein